MKDYSLIIISTEFNIYDLFNNSLIMNKKNDYVKTIVDFIATMIIIAIIHIIFYIEFKTRCTSSTKAQAY